MMDRFWAGLRLFSAVANDRQIDGQHGRCRSARRQLRANRGDRCVGGVGKMGSIVGATRRVVPYADHATVPELLSGLGDYFDLYNYERPHQSLGYCTPADVHFAVNVPIL
ncbi:MAG: transposase [Anaerolineae bacterium]|nr:transposase [Anaerolineae bacterium]